MFKLFKSAKTETPLLSEKISDNNKRLAFSVNDVLNTEYITDIHIFYSKYFVPAARERE